MKILITGGSGCLGINLVRFLLNKGHRDIVCLDIADFDPSEKNRISFIKGDIRNSDAVAEALKGVDAVVHAAAALPLYKRQDIYSTEVDGTRNVIDQAYKNNVNLFVHISSTAVYGVPDHHPILENDPLLGAGDYGKAKIMAEQVCLEYRKKGMNVPILRPKSFIGPERLGVFSLLYEWAKDGRNFPVPGTGKNRYQLLDVEDLCEAIYLCLTTRGGTVNDTFNIGAKVFATIQEDFQVVLDRAGFGKKIRIFPVGPLVCILQLAEFLRISPIYEWIYKTICKDSFVSIEKAERKLGFHPRFSNKEALLRNYSWYLENAGILRNRSGITHRVPWKNGILNLAKAVIS